MPRDPMAVLEAAYDLGSSEESWMTGVLTAMRPLLDRGHGVYGFTYELTPEAGWQLGNMALIGCASNWADAMASASGVAKPAEIGALLLNRPCQSVSQALQRASTHGSAPSESAGLIASLTGYRDQLVVNAAEDRGVGCTFVALTERPMRFPPRTAGVLSRLARHIAAARRLRSMVTGTAERTIEADAVLSTGGRVLHADGAVRRRGLQTLSEAARLICESRLRLRDTDPEQALHLWTALIDGQWSIVDTVDSDGKRLLLARRNVPDLHEPRALTPDERHVLSLAARGHSLSLLCYELGLSRPRVSEQLSRAVRKLGFRSRAELVRYFGPRDLRP